MRQWPDMKSVAILGSTGSIGVNSLEVLRLHPQRYRPFLLTANNNVEKLARQVTTFEPDHALVADIEALPLLRDTLQALGYKGRTQLHCGMDAAGALLGESELDLVVAGIVGAAGLRPTLAAADAGKRILLANKEVLVCAGKLFMHRAQLAGAEILPLDSEHNAIFQCWPNALSPDNSGVRRILLTASGGPFRGFSADQLRGVTAEQACSHPNWSMGKKISIDSASLMNKGLELIEACTLFALPQQQIEVLVHPQSIVHSLVEYLDGSQLAQLSSPDMRTPIAHALAWPERIESGVPWLDLIQARNLSFEPVDDKTFRCLALARQACATGGSASLYLNSANEIAVEGFLQGKIRFTSIGDVVENTLQFATSAEPETLEQVIELDCEARALARQQIAGLSAAYE